MKTAIEAIDALGGTTKVATRFGVKPSAVSNWRAANRIPDRLHFRFAETCRRERINWLPPSESDSGEAA